MQITFGAACSPPLPTLPSLARGSARCSELAVTPLWHGVCLALVTSAWPRSVGASISAARLPGPPPSPPPQLQPASGSLSLGLHHEKHPTWELYSRTWAGAWLPEPGGGRSRVPTCSSVRSRGPLLGPVVVLQGCLLALCFLVLIFVFLAALFRYRSHTPHRSPV